MPNENFPSVPVVVMRANCKSAGDRDNAKLRRQGCRLKAPGSFGYPAPHLVDPATQTGPGFRHYRWLICALLFYATSVNYIDRQILSLIKEFLVRDFGINNTQFGAINAAF